MSTEEDEMRSDTQTVSISTDPSAVSAFVGNPENLPRWAIGFAKSVRADGGRWVVATGHGEVGLTIEVGDAAGTVDFCMEPAPGVAATAYARVVPNGQGSEFVFTQFQQPGVSDDVFDQLVAAVTHELVALKAVLEIECPL
jgi:hypothetical protein